MKNNPFDVGISIEKEGIQFYSKALKIANNLNSKKLLEYLISEEEKHLAYFLKAKKQYIEGKTISKGPDHKNFLFSKNMYKKIEEVEDKLVKIFQTAIKMEQEAAKFYLGWAEKETDNGFKSILKTLAKFEEDHEKLIKTHSEVLYNYLYWEGTEQPPIES